ncbi:hypothetical protein QVD17_32349 [Tagetes erecta]|uniref:Reverse transcriptase zinc-binding domain-containing protein n=1 Tax=Tagetes erecta TaxID=13708 RepID=A0AAD8K7F5_TARER|nr:hypothetical protein QVD17_32349 [Tagetes erecta]
MQEPALPRVLIVVLHDDFLIIICQIHEEKLILKFVAQDQQHNFKWNNWVNIFGWRAAKERLPAKKAYTVRGVPIDLTLCSFCDEDEEDLAHILTTYEPICTFCDEDEKDLLEKTKEVNLCYNSHNLLMPMKIDQETT